MPARVREHIRKNAYGIVAVFIAIGGTAYAVDGPNPGQNTVGSEDIIGNEIKSDDIGNGRIFNLDVADEILTGAKIKDGTLSNADVGVFYAEVNGAGVLQTSSGGVTSSRVPEVSAGRYEVDFGRDVSQCAATATIGPDESDPDPSVGAINVADGLTSAEVVQVSTQGLNGTVTDKPFRLIVAC